MLQRRSNSEVLQLRIPSELQQAISRIANRDCVPVSAFVRQTLAERLRREGVVIGGSDPAHRTPLPLKSGA